MYVVVCVIILLFALPGWAATYHVAKTGCSGSCSDSNSCAQAQNLSDAKLTLTGGSGAIQCLSASDTLIVHPGTYAEQITSGIIPSGTAGNPTIIQAQSGTAGSITAWIKPPNSAGPAVTIGNSSSYITILNLGVDAVDISPNAAENGGIVVGSSTFDPTNNIILDGVELKNLSGSNEDAVVFRPGTTDIVIQNCYIHDIQDADPETSPNNGVYLQGSTTANPNIVRDCTFENLNNVGINFRCAEGCSDPEGYRNVIKNVGNCFSSSLSVTGGMFYNNICQTGDEGVLMIDGTTPEVYNNTIVDITDDCARQNGGTPLSATQAANFKNNICWNTTDTAPSQVADNLYTDPSFVNEAGGDFHLTLGSAAIDVGVDLSGTVDDDFDKVPRPQNGIYDYGAFEFNSGLGFISDGTIDSVTGLTSMGFISDGTIDSVIVQ